MPRPRSLLQGIAILLCCACSGTAASAPAPSPSPSHLPSPVATVSIGTGNAPWALNLDFSGDLNAHVAGTAIADQAIHNECTGPNSARLGAWASTMAITIGSDRYSLVILTTTYRGAATFTDGVKVVVTSVDQSRVWQNGPGDSVSFTVGTSETAGLLEAQLSRTSAPASKLKISGHWSCQP